MYYLIRSNYNITKDNHLGLEAPPKSDAGSVKTGTPDGLGDSE